MFNLILPFFRILDIDRQAAISSHKKYKDSMICQVENKELPENNKEVEEEMKIIRGNDFLHENKRR